MDQYEIEILFSERKKVGNNLYEIMRERGYTKISFSKTVNISRPTLNHLFEGEISNITTFEKYIEKISSVLQIEESDLFAGRSVAGPAYQAVYSRNEPKDYEPEENVKEMFDILRNIIDLCDFYY